MSPCCKTFCKFAGKTRILITEIDVRQSIKVNKMKTAKNNTEFDHKQRKCI